jgi:hypothetical protein
MVSVIAVGTGILCGLFVCKTGDAFQDFVVNNT